MILLAILACAQADPLPSPSIVPKIIKTEGVRRTDVDKWLGKPFEVKSGDDHDLAHYRAKGVTAISVYYFARGGGKPLDTPGPIHVSFPKGTTGAQALKIVGFDKKVSLGRARADLQGDRFVLGHGLKIVEVYWVEAKAKYPDGTAKAVWGEDAHLLFDPK